MKHFLLKKTNLIVLILSLILPILVQAQCPSSITFGSHSITPSTCIKNGGIVINSNTSDPSTLYQIITGPSGFTTNPQSNATFNSLSPGDYTIRVTCGSAVATTSVITVPGSYTQMTTFNYTLSNCSSGSGYNTLEVTSVTGGNPSYQYGYLLSGDVNADDALFTWGAATTINLPSAGTYQIRVRDACNNGITRTVATQTANAYSNLSFTPNNFCDNKLNGIFSFSISPFTIPHPGASVEIYAGNSTVTAATGTRIYQSLGYLTSASNRQTGILSVPAGATHIFIRVLNPCGVQVLQQTYSLPAQSAPVLNSVSAAFYGGTACDRTTSPTQQIQFNLNWQGGANPAVTAVYVTGYSGPNATGTIIIPEVDVLPNNNRVIGYATSYRVRVVTACGETTFTVNGPVDPAITIASITQTKIFCPAPDPNNVRVVISLSGYRPSGTTYKVIKQPEGTEYVFTEGVNGISLPPGNYVLQAFHNDCVLQTTNTNFTVTMPSTIYPSSTLETELKPGCNDGLTSIIATINAQNLPANGNLTIRRVTGTGSTAIYYRAFTGATVNTQITITNADLYTNQVLSAGTYEIAFNYNCNFCCINPQSTKQTINIPPTGQLILTKQKGMNCDDNTNGTAYLEYVGAGPFSIERKLASQPETSYQNLATGITATHYLDQNLAENTTYTYRIHNSCGSYITTDVSTSSLTTIQKITGTNPCVGLPYDLSVENIQDATYSWTLNGNTIAGTTNTIHFENYTALNDGQYICTVIIAGCVTRTVTFNLSSQLCNQPLYATFGNINVFFAEGTLQIDWEILKEENVDYYQIEVSTDGVNFKPIQKISSKVNGNIDEITKYSISIQEKIAFAGIFSIFLLPFAILSSFKSRRKTIFTILSILIISVSILACNKKKDDHIADADNHNLFVRIAVVDRDGTIGYSKIIKPTKK